MCKFLKGVLHEGVCPAPYFFLFLSHWNAMAAAAEAMTDQEKHLEMKVMFEL